VAHSRQRSESLVGRGGSNRRERRRTEQHRAEPGALAPELMAHIADDMLAEGLQVQPLPRDRSFRLYTEAANTFFAGYQCLLGTKTNLDLMELF